MRSLFEKIKLFIKDRSKQLRWIVGGVLGIVAGITLFLFAIINTSSVRGTLINNATTSTEQSVHLSYLHLKNYHDEITQRGSTIADELHSVRKDEEAVLSKMTDIYHLNIDVIYLTFKTFQFDKSPTDFNCSQYSNIDVICSTFETSQLDKSPTDFNCLHS